VPGGKRKGGGFNKGRGGMGGSRSQVDLKRAIGTGKTVRQEVVGEEGGRQTKKILDSCQQKKRSKEESVKLGKKQRALKKQEVGTPQKKKG